MSKPDYRQRPPVDAPKPRMDPRTFAVVAVLSLILWIALGVSMFILENVVPL